MNLKSRTPLILALLLMHSATFSVGFFERITTFLGSSRNRGALVLGGIGMAGLSYLAYSYYKKSSVQSSHKIKAQLLPSRTPLLPAKSKIVVRFLNQNSQSKNEIITYLAQTVQGVSIGYVVCRQEGLIHHIVIDENFRGQGLGEKLLTYAIQNTKRDFNPPNFQLFTNENNKVAQGLYEKLGFKIISKKAPYYCYQLDGAELTKLTATQGVTKP